MKEYGNGKGANPRPQQVAGLQVSWNRVEGNKELEYDVFLKYLCSCAKCFQCFLEVSLVQKQVF
jgi:hypothetical protein